MRYYKIIRDGAVIGAGTTFLRWFTTQGRYFYCDMEDRAECVQDVITERLFHADWLNNPPEGAYQPTEAEVVLIDATEYDEIIALLDGGEEIPVDPDPEPEPGPTPEPDPEPEPERPMSVQEMRERIAQLTAQVLNESKPFTAEQTYKAGEIIANGARVYIAGQVIVKGETVVPGVNCTETTIAEVLNALQAQQ